MTMSTRIGSHIFRGELYNHKRNSVVGWIDFGGDWGVRVALTGNMSGELAGQQVQFQASRPTTDADCSKEVIDALANEQCGVVGVMEVRATSDGQRSLYLEWFSQNGQVIAEIADPNIELGPFEEEKDASEPPTTDPLLESGDALDFLNGTGEEEDDDDPYKLFPPDLDQQLAEASDGPGEQAAEQADDIPYDVASYDPDREAESPPRGERSWDEVIPGIDPATKRMYEEWDEVIHGTKDVPFTDLFDPPLTLKRPADIADEADAIEQLRLLLGRLALHCVVIHMCHHATATETYRWLLEDLLPEEGVHPRLGPTGFIRHYDTGEHCDACDAEFEARWNARKKDDE